MIHREREPSSETLFRRNQDCFRAFFFFSFSSLFFPEPRPDPSQFRLHFTISFPRTETRPESIPPVLYYFSGLRAVTKLRRGAVRERSARRRRIFFGVFPSNGTEKRSRLCTAGWERDGKAGRQKVDEMGWELIISRWDGNGREVKRS